MKYSTLVDVYEELDSTSKRLEKTAFIADFLKKVSKVDLPSVMLLLEGKVYPDWDSRKIGVASQLMIRAIANSSGSSPSKIEELWKKTGDLGKAAEKAMGKKSQHTLGNVDISVAKVISNTQSLSKIEGSGSVDRKIGLIVELLSSASADEAKYIVKTILEEMRVGIGSGTIRDSLALAFFKYNVDAKLKIQQAYDLTNDWGKVAEAAMKGIPALEKIEMTVGIPIKVMLAQKVESIEEGFERCGSPMIVEYKYDGFRMQIHKQDGKISLFTRRLENVTGQFPDVSDAVEKYVAGESFILESEIVGFDPKSQKYLPFQNISQRIKRKYRIEEMVEKFPVEINVFDAISFEKKNLTQIPLVERRKIIEKIIKPKERIILPSKMIVTEKKSDVEKMLKDSLKSGNEGVMLKNLNSPYQPGSRVGFMVKLKPAAETLDLVIVGAEWGEGKRSAWITSYVLAIRTGDQLMEIGKVSTGMKEKDEEGLSFNQMTELLKPLITSEDGKSVKVKPKIVIEVGFEEIQRSPTYSSGFALRFPRVIRLRDDRSPDDSSTIEEVETLLSRQKKHY